MNRSLPLQAISFMCKHPLQNVRCHDVALLAICVLVSIPATVRAEDLRVAVFDVDVTPPIGSMMAYDPVKAQGELGLRGRGVILLGAGEPIVLCAIDWIGISNEAHDVFRQKLAEAAGTTPQRVAVHTVHQHDALECGFANERLLRERGLPLGPYEGSFARAALERLAAAVRGSLSEGKPVTHLGLGQAEVHEVASNRRLLGPDGKVRATRWTTTTDPNLRAEPEGTIDPVVSLVSFWNGEQPLAVLSYYACHPQSYYRTGVANPDFPGIARFLRQLQVPDALHIHFNGAGGNLGAGKYNDGSHGTRWLLAQRLADGMKRAWNATEKFPLTADDVDWKVVSVALPPATHLKEGELEAAMRESDKVLLPVVTAQLAWLQRCQAGHRMDLCCLRLGRARVLHMPGELFVEYQLAAKQMRQDLFVTMAAYGDYGPGYIGTALAYEQGGYETGPHASSVAPGVETVLLEGMRGLLRDAESSSVTTTASKPMPADETPGPRPYEMVWADRKPPHMPLVGFDSLQGWRVECREGAVADLIGSQRQRVWESPVARLVYRGTSDASTVILRPGAPVAIPDDVSATTLWVYGNNWSWAPEPGTPRTTIALLVLDRDDAAHTLHLAQVGWKEWWLVHKVLPQSLRDKRPLRFAGLQITGGSNTEDRELFFEDLVFFEENPAPLSFEPRPKRGIDPFPGQSPGANTGPGRLPFPTREQTILPDNLTTDFVVDLERVGESWRFRYRDAETRLEYEVRAGTRFWEPVVVTLNGAVVARAMAEAGPQFVAEAEDARLIEAQAVGNELKATWRARVNGTEVVIQSTSRLWQKSLVVDCVCTGGLATGLSYGRIEGVENPELLRLPYMNYGGHHLNVLMSKGKTPYFASVWMDWYRSNASAPYCVDKIDADEVQLNGGVRYQPKTDGRRNDLYERFFVTFSPTFEETLATIANPPAKRGREAATRLWQESWGPDNYEREHERSKKLHAYGIELLTQCNHEITWRDGGESFTFRDRAAPGKGGDEALKKYVAAQRSLGWRAGLYTNYTDFASVNAYWDTDRVMRGSNGDLVTAWPRCYSPKSLFAVEMDRKLAPLIQSKFDTNAAYTDVHTSVSPWDRTDFDARVPGAGTFAATFYAYGELLLHDQDVYDGHCWSEGNHQWLYAGLCTGNYGLAYSGLRLWEYPYLPHFDLLKMHPLSVDIGVPWTGQFFAGKEGWSKPENLVASIDQFLAATIAYGHIGWLVEEAHGMRQTCRSYYMLQPLQSRYAMLKPQEIRYGTDHGLVSSSEAFRSGDWRKSKIFIRYPNGLRIWVNGNAGESWQVPEAGQDLPPFGWLALGTDGFVECSASLEGQRYDRVSSPECVFLDGRGVWRGFDGVATSGSVAIRYSKDRAGVSIILIEGVDRLVLTRPEGSFGPDDLRTRIAAILDQPASVLAYDQDGVRMGEVATRRVGSEWEIVPPESAIRLDIAAMPR